MAQEAHIRRVNKELLWIVTQARPRCDLVYGKSKTWTINCRHLKIINLKYHLCGLIHESTETVLLFIMFLSMYLSMYITSLLLYVLVYSFLYYIGIQP